MDWLPVALVAIGGGAIATQVVRNERKANVLRDEAWQVAARRLGGDPVVVPATFFRSARRSMRFEAEESPAVLRAFTRRQGKQSLELTRLAIGPLPPLADVTLHVEPRSVFGVLQKSLGFGEIEVAAGAFDDDIRVTGSPAPLVRALLDPRARRSILSRRAAFDIEGDTLVIESEGQATEADVLVEMVRYAEVIVRRWNVLARAPRELAHALGLEGDTRLALGERASLVGRGLRRGKTVELFVRLTDEKLETILSIGGSESALTWDRLEVDEDDALASLERALDTGGAYR